MNYHDECARRSRINRVIRDMMPVIPNARRYRYGIVHPDYRTHSVIWWTPKDGLWRMMARNSRGVLFEALTTPDANIARRIFADTWGSECKALCPRCGGHGGWIEDNERVELEVGCPVCAGHGYATAQQLAQALRDEWRQNA